jgi:proteasome lid subunit RPN8/RPN11
VSGELPGLTLPRAVAEEILAHARAGLPNEACGLVAGAFDAAGSGRASVFHAARNAEASPLRYNVDAADLVRIVFAIEDAGEDLVAIFHSHTRSPAVPSATDRRTAQYDRPFYLLASLAEPDAAPERALRAWRIMGGHSFEVPLRVT